MGAPGINGQRGGPGEGGGAGVSLLLIPLFSIITETANLSADMSVRQRGYLAPLSNIVFWVVRAPAQEETQDII